MTSVATVPVKISPCWVVALSRVWVMRMGMVVPGGMVMLLEGRGWWGRLEAGAEPELEAEVGRLSDSGAGVWTGRLARVGGRRAGLALEPGSFGWGCDGRRSGRRRGWRLATTAGAGAGRSGC